MASWKGAPYTSAVTQLCSACKPEQGRVFPSSLLIGVGLFRPWMCHSPPYSWYGSVWLSRILLLQVEPLNALPLHTSLVWALLPALCSHYYLKGSECRQSCQRRKALICVCKKIRRAMRSTLEAVSVAGRQHGGCQVLHVLEAQAAAWLLPHPAHTRITQVGPHGKGILDHLRNAATVRTASLTPGQQRVSCCCLAHGRADQSDIRPSLQEYSCHWPQ